ncbi:MAG TPA: DUF262 domain-containing HNH endonuclease family protein [Pyrinomonadaceae bacterium]|nr:DUF262 domain-containing HNH endonuclease family protein [Pyrinomonadaceae bacterium]
MPDKAVGLDILAETVGHVLSQKGYRVPPSQRSYRWEAEHVEDWCKDLNVALFDGADEYFVGTIVGIKSGSATYIFDGQQRLATTMILIGAIRDYFYVSGDEETTRIIEEGRLMSKDRKTHEPTAHFKLNSVDQQFFQDRILLRPDDPIRKAAKPQRHRGSHKRIEKAAKICKDFVKNTIVKGLPPDKAGDALHRWLDYIDESLQAIWVQVADEPTAFRIFETMNDRGLKLSAADLLKNYLYAQAADDREHVIQKWDSMTGVLETIEGEEENVLEYVRCYWITHHGPTRTKVLFDQIREKTTNKPRAIALASELETVAQDYAAILLSSHPSLASRGANVRTKIETLRSFGVTQLRPLLLAAFQKFSAKEFNKLLDACVSWSVRSLLSGVPSGTLEGYYSRNALKITKGEIKTAAQVGSDMMKVVPDDAKFKASVASANVSNEKLSRYYLRALQRCADRESEPQYIPNPGSEITLEHIMPENPGAGWEHVSDEDRRTFLKRLGNQALLTGTVNSKLGNVKYDLKKPALKASEYSLTQETSTFTSWGPAEIEKHQQKLADLAVKTWPL